MFDEDLSRLKKDDSYHFSIPFEYIKKNYGNDNYDIGIAYMEVDVIWDDFNQGYKITHYCPDMQMIDPAEGNSDEDEFFECQVEYLVREKLDLLGIYTEAICV